MIASGAICYSHAAEPQRSIPGRDVPTTQAGGRHGTPQIDTIVRKGQ